MELNLIVMIYLTSRLIQYVCDALYQTFRKTLFGSICFLNRIDIQRSIY